MKLASFSFLLLLLIFSNEVASQERLFQFNLENVTVREVFETIEKNSEFIFLYNERWIDVNRRITIKSENEPIKVILNQLFKGTNHEYRIYDRQIVVLKSEKEEEKESNPQHNNSEPGFTRKHAAVRGNVYDTDGHPLPGVAVQVKGTTLGTVTASDGSYMVPFLTDEGILVFSFIGMRRQELAAQKNSTLNVIMKVDAIGLEEIVAVGYGTQKKVNLTGSIANVELKDQESRAVTQSSQLLAGKISGVTVLQPSGQPGKNGSNIFIRGLGTFSRAGNQPLVLIDGLASSLDNVNPNDIERISVLKDAASASIYGTRAANGVILIKTKRGEKAGYNISYNGYAGWKKVNELPENVNSWEHAMLINEALMNVNQGNSYSQAEILKFMDGSDPENYPNVNHLRDLLNSGLGFQSNHHINFTSSSDKNSYFFSAGYLDEKGLVSKTVFNRYSLLFNFDSHLKENLLLTINLNGSKSFTNEPIRHIEVGNVASLIGFAQQVPNTIPGKKADGSYGHWHDFGISAIIDHENFSHNKEGTLLGSLNLGWELFDDFFLTGKMGYYYENFLRDLYHSIINYDDVYTFGPNALLVRTSDVSMLTLQALANYEVNIKDNQIYFLAGYSQEESRYDFMQAFRDNFPNDLLFELNAGSAANMKNNGTAAEWALRSYFGRINYAFKEKYLLEGNLRYDGTSRFPAENRWAVFPSFSAGWRVSEEPFLKNHYFWLNNLKVRASWGILGNQNVGNYPYQRLISPGRDYVFGGVLFPGAFMAEMANRDIRWERTEMTNLGLDVSVFGSRLNVVVDYFQKYTSGILYRISVSDVLGMLPNELNAGEVKNTGFEIMVDYTASLKKIDFKITPNFSLVKNSVRKISNAEYDINSGLFPGEPIGAIYGYVADGLFINQQDIDSYSVQPYAVRPGFIRYKDINGPDGIPDGKVEPEFDRKIIGSRIPKINYGLNLQASYSGVFFSVQLQGVAGNQNYLPGNYQQTAFVNGGTAQRWQMENRWTYANPDRNASYPIMLVGSNSGFRFISTYWLRNAGFLQVKNIQLGYNLPSELLASIGVENLKVYVNGENVYRFDKFYPGWDPEMDSSGGNGQFYPNTAVYSIGFKLNI